MFTEPSEIRAARKILQNYDPDTASDNDVKQFVLARQAIYRYQCQKEWGIPNNVEFKVRNVNDIKMLNSAFRAYAEAVLSGIVISAYKNGKIAGGKVYPNLYTKSINGANRNCLKVEVWCQETGISIAEFDVYMDIYTGG